MPRFIKGSSAQPRAFTFSNTAQIFFRFNAQFIVLPQCTCGPHQTRTHSPPKRTETRMPAPMHANPHIHTYTCAHMHAHKHRLARTQTERNPTIPKSIDALHKFCWVIRLITLMSQKHHILTHDVTVKRNYNENNKFFISNTWGQLNKSFFPH